MSRIIQFNRITERGHTEPYAVSINAITGIRPSTKPGCNRHVDAATVTNGEVVKVFLGNEAPFKAMHTFPAALDAWSQGMGGAPGAEPITIIVPVPASRTLDTSSIAPIPYVLPVEEDIREGTDTTPY